MKPTPHSLFHLIADVVDVRAFGEFHMLKPCAAKPILQEIAISMLLRCWFWSPLYPGSPGEVVIDTGGRLFPFFFVAYAVSTTRIHPTPIPRSHFTSPSTPAKSLFTQCFHLSFGVPLLLPSILGVSAVVNRSPSMMMKLPKY